MSNHSDERPARAHLVLLTHSFPYGAGEEFRADEMPILSEAFARVTIVSGAPDRPRPIPPKCQVVCVPEAAIPSRGTVLPRAMAHLLEELRVGQGLSTGVYMLRSLVYYLRHASAAAVTVRTLAIPREDDSRLCFYSYWMDHAALAAARLRRQYPGSAAVSRAHGWDLYAARHPHGCLPLRRHIVRAA
jgi:colanic acid/amylovoran biosynthesis glycosyltransferase